MKDFREKFINFILTEHMQKRENPLYRIKNWTIFLRFLNQKQ